MTTTYRSPPGASGLGRKAAGALLEPAEYLLVKGLFVPPGLHRLYNATGLSLGLLGGRQFMNIVVGHTPDGTAIQRQEVPLPLRPFHGLLNYNVYSDDPRDRWMHAIDNVAPAILGAAGVLASSRIYFRENLAKAAHIEAEALAGLHLPRAGKAASAFTFADADTAISMRHAEPYASATAGSSLFGSASAYNLLPWVGNYASMLGTLFSRRAERMVGMASADIPNLEKFLAQKGQEYPWLKNAPRWMKNPLAFLTNTKANYPISPGEMFTQFAHVFHNNPAEAVETQREFWGLGSGIMLSWLKKADAFHIENFIKDYQRFLKEAKHLSPSEASKEYLTNHFEKFCVREGLLDFSNPQKLAECVDVGNGGMIGRFAEWAGMRGPANTLRQRFAEGLYARNHAYAEELHGQGKLHFGGQPVTPGSLPGPGESTGSLKPESRHGGLKVSAAAGAGLLGMAALGSWSAERPEEPKRQDGHGSNRLASFINHHPLDAAEWLGNSLNFPPSAHRWLNAFGLTAGMYSGMKVMEVLTGLDVRGRRLNHLCLFGKAIPELMKIPEKPLLAYNFHGTGLQDRWMKVLHMAAPAAMGFYGNKLGSDWYFQPQQKRVRNPEYIDDYSSRIAFDQSRPWGYLTAATSLANVGIGLNFLPFSYGMNMGTRFTLGSDRSTILPGVKELWSNNHSRSPLKPSKLRDEMINYMVGNPAKEPRLLEEKIRGILGPWFGQQPDTVINQFAADVMEVRNKYWKEGGIPAQDRAKCKRELRERFVGKGLHAELDKLGLDVLKAHLADNGLSGDIANALGARAAVNRDIAEFREKELARRAGNKPQDADKEPVQEGRRPSFTERLAENRDRQQGTSQAVQ